MSERSGERSRAAHGPYFLRASCLAAVAALVVLALAHAARISFYGGDDLIWLRHVRRGIIGVWAEPSPFYYYRPVFCSWMIGLVRLGAGSPASLALAGLVPTILLFLAASWGFVGIFRERETALMAATFLLVNPARQEHLFWTSAHSDALCLLFSIVCVGIVLRSAPADLANPWRLALVALLTALAALSKEIGMGVPLAILVLPGAGSVRAHLPLSGASSTGVLAAAGLGSLVLGGTGRPGHLVARTPSLALFGYPTRLTWAGDLSAWVMRARREGSYGSPLAVCAVTLVIAAALAWPILRCRREPWVRAGLVLVGAGALPYIVSQADRSIGMGCAGLGILLAGAVCWWSKDTAWLRAVLLVAIMVTWSPLWLKAERRWTEATRVALDVSSSVRAWREEVGPKRLLVPVGTIERIGQGTKAPCVFDFDVCSLDLLSVEGEDPVPPARAQRVGGSASLRVEAEGDSYLARRCRPALEIGIVDVECDAGGYTHAAVLDPTVLSNLPIAARCGAPDVRRWDGRRFVVLSP